MKKKLFWSNFLIFRKWRKKLKPFQVTQFKVNSILRLVFRMYPAKYILTKKRTCLIILSSRGASFEDSWLNTFDCMPKIRDWRFMIYQFHQLRNLVWVCVHLCRFVRGSGWRFACACNKNPFLGLETQWVVLGMAFAFIFHFKHSVCYKVA